LCNPHVLLAPRGDPWIPKVAEQLTLRHPPRPKRQRWMARILFESGSCQQLSGVKEVVIGKSRVFWERRDIETGRQQGVHSRSFCLQVQVHPRHRLKIGDRRERKLLRKYRCSSPCPVIAERALATKACGGSHESARQHKCQQSFHHLLLRKVGFVIVVDSPAGRRTHNQRKRSLRCARYAASAIPSSCRQGPQEPGLGLWPHPSTPPDGLYPRRTPARPPRGRLP